MTKHPPVGFTEPRTIHCGRVNQLVHDQGVADPGDTGKQSGVRRVAAAEQEPGRGVVIIRKLPFQGLHQQTVARYQP